MKKSIGNQKLFFISLAGIVMVSLMLITTYAYQTLQVEYAPSSKKEMSVSSGVLDVNFEISNILNITDMTLLPDYKTADYIEFTLNNNSSSDVAYNISLKELEYLPIMASSDFKYSIVDVTNGETLLATGDFGNLSGNTYSLNFASGKFDFMKQGEVKKLRIYLWLLSTEEDQSKFETNSFKGKVEVTSVFSSDINDNTLAYNIYNTNMLSNSNLLSVPDNFGTSYFYKSDAVNNYININNMCFRIVRLEGDGSTKLVLENKDNTCENSNVSLPFINNNGDYVTSLNTWYDESLKDISVIKEEAWCNDSDIKYDINTKEILNDSNANDYLYESGLKVLESENYEATLRCNNVTKSKVGLLSVDELTSIGINKTHTSNYLTDNINDIWLTNAKYGNLGGNLNYIVIDNGVLSKNTIENISIRPSIVLNSNTSIISGDGTKTSPYIIEQ